MALLEKSDLKCTYSWTVLKNDDPKVTGEPDSTELNKHEGYEALPFINRYAENHDIKDKKTGLEIEQLIRNDLPSNKRSHAHVTEWLEENLNKNTRGIFKR